MKLYHVSNPANRESILTNGLLPKVGSSYSCHYEDNVMGPVVFVSLKNDYDSTYDDDRYLIYLSEEEFRKLNFKEDKEVNGGLFTRKKIKSKYLTLIHKGTGESTF